MNGDIQIEYVLKLVLVHWGHCGTDVRIIGKNKDHVDLLPPTATTTTVGHYCPQGETYSPIS